MNLSVEHTLEHTDGLRMTLFTLKVALHELSCAELNYGKGAHPSEGLYTGCTPLVNKV